LRQASCHSRAYGGFEIDWLELRHGAPQLLNNEARKRIKAAACAHHSAQSPSRSDQRLDLAAENAAWNILPGI